MRERLHPTFYRDVFELDPRGAQVLEELIAIFGGNPYVKGGVEGARQTDFNAGRNAPIHYILNRINQANGATEDNEIET